tara:strand:- start:932 stop:1360 length:429 start_codon:yes stop_codon:yes gene_type:complete
MKKALSILLALQVLLSSLSFHIGMHFCGEELQSFSLFDKAMPCQQASAAKENNNTCPFHAQKNPEEKGCCSDKEIVVHGQEHQSVLSSFSIDFAPHFDFTLAFVARLSHDFFGGSEAADHYNHYTPPLLLTDIPVITQSLLI